MAKRKQAVKRKNAISEKPAVINTTENGLTEAIMGFDPGSMGTQLNQTDTLFINNRWYLLSNMRQVLSQAYVEHGLIQALVSVPVDDALRGGYDIKTKQLAPEQIEDLLNYIDRHSINSSVVAQAMKWNRLFGGAGILVITEQDPAEPISLEAIGPDSKIEFRAIDMWEMFTDKQNMEYIDPASGVMEPEFYSYYGVRTHKSRVIRLKGVIAPSFIRPRLRGWGFSVVESLVASINQYFKSNNLSFEILDEFKLDIFKFKNLAQTLLSADGTALVQKRVAAMNAQKNFQNALSLDSEDDFVQKQITFGGIAEMMREFRIQIASDMRMPLTKLFGISASGFNSGEDDIENYNAMIESEIRSKCKYEIIAVVEIICQKLFGFIPDDLKIEFKPLRILSAEQEETVKTSKLNRVIQAMQSGLCSAAEAKAAINKDNLLPVALDTTGDTIEMDKGEFVSEHKELVDVLKSPSKKDDKAEAAKQEKELEAIEPKV